LCWPSALCLQALQQGRAACDLSSKGNRLNFFMMKIATHAEGRRRHRGASSSVGA